MTVAVGAGSRGLTGRVELLRGTITALRELGAEPFVVPAMGSHGGATAEGQQAMLAALGVTAESVGAEIRSTMETVDRRPRRRRTRPIHLDTHAAGADRILPVNRVKPHTAFHGPIESGCTKMAVVGFGKQPGAAQFHASGAGEMRDRLARRHRRPARPALLGGVASVEGPTGAVVAVRALSADEIGGAAEQELTDAGEGARADGCRSPRSTCSSSSAAARTSPARRSTPTSPAASGSPGSTTRRRRGCR